MREIKFRVWNNKHKKWVHAPGEEVNLFGEMILLGGFMHKVSLEGLDDCIALQFTGVKDKNGKDIYEGDIVKVCYFESWMRNNCEDVYWAVFYNDGIGAFRMGSEYAMDNYMLGARGMELMPNCEVVGNVFENPELLK